MYYTAVIDSYWTVMHINMELRKVLLYAKRQRKKIQ